MKKIIIAMAAIAAAFTMASCNKELVNPNENPTVGKSVITASIENDLTKAYLDANGNDTDGYKVFWSKGDNLLVGELDENGCFNNWLAEYKLEDSSAGSSNGTFSWHTGNTFIPLNESCQEPSFKRGTMYLATYPFDLAESENYDYLIWKTEQAYSETDRYIPMYAEAEGLENGTADFKFCNLGGMLRLTLKGSASIRSIKISAAKDEAMSGTCFIIEDANGNMVGEISYELAEDFGDVFNYIILDCGENGVRLTDSGTDFFISIPCHIIYDDDDKMKVVGYSDVTITLTDTEGRTCEKKLNNKNLVIERSKITTATFTASEFKSNVPEGALPGKFSVSADKQVYFSQGNLYWDGESYQFESNQTDRGESNWSEGECHVSHFAWSMDEEKARARSFDDGSKSEDDVLFTNVSGFEVNGQQNIWRALSSDELTYLLGTTDPYFTNHRNVDKRFAAAKVNDINGLLIFPDDFMWSDAMGEEPEKYNIMPVTATSVNYGINTYDADEFSAIQKAGVVFLPVTGYYIYEEYTNPGFGLYWSCDSSTNEGICAHSFFFGDGFHPDGEDYREYAFPIRLVTDVK